jgi:brefeldin A-inhibited guanine nucleotide-exchange protein
MKHLPNLLKQETSSAETLVSVLLRMYCDPRPQHLTLRPQVADKFLPYVAFFILSKVQLPIITGVLSLGLGVVSDFNKLRMEHNAKNITTFMPVVAKIVQGFSGLDDKAVRPPFSPSYIS